MKIAPPKSGSNFNYYSTKINKKLNLNVTSATENVYLALLCTLDFGWTEVTNRGKFVEDRDSEWHLTWSFQKYSFAQLNNYMSSFDREWHKIHPIDSLYL